MTKNKYGWDNAYRDPNRFDKVFGVIRKVWGRHPDLRLGQLIVNALPPGRDPFFVEDEELLDYLEAYLERFK